MTTNTKNSTSTRVLASGTRSDTVRQEAVRKQARAEIPALRKQAEQGIATLKRLAAK